MVLIHSSPLPKIVFTSLFVCVYRVFGENAVCYNSDSLYTRAEDRKYIPANIKSDYPQGTCFVLRYKHPATGKRNWETLGDMGVTMAYLVAKRRQDELKKGTELTPEAKPDAGSTLLAPTIERYVLMTRGTKAKDTAQRYEYSLRQFQKGCEKQYVERIKVSDLEDFVMLMKKAGLADRTCHNRVGNVVTFLRSRGIK